MDFLPADLIQWVDQLMQQYGLLAVFVLVFLESSGLPLPGETALVTAAIYAGHTGAFELYEVIGVATAAAVLGDTISALHTGHAANVAVAFGTVEQMLTILLQTARSGCRDQAGMEIAVRDLPSRAALGFVSGRIARRPRQAMK